MFHWVIFSKENLSDPANQQIKLLLFKKKKGGGGGGWGATMHLG